MVIGVVDATLDVLAWVLEVGVDLLLVLVVHTVGAHLFGFLLVDCNVALLAFRATKF